MKVLFAVFVVFSFFAGGVWITPAHADTFVSVDSQTSLTDAGPKSTACVSLNEQTKCYNNVGSLQVQSNDASINIGLDTFITYE